MGKKIKLSISELLKIVEETEVKRRYTSRPPAKTVFLVNQWIKELGLKKGDIRVGSKLLYKQFEKWAMGKEEEVLARHFYHCMKNQFRKVRWPEGWFFKLNRNPLNDQEKSSESCQENDEEKKV